jgi:DNA-binding MurR/RpiR family transcriptional regulator
MESALFAIREHLPDFTAAEKKVADYILDEGRKVLHYNVAELARQSGVSQAAVIRFCRRIGAESFSDFKLRLSHDVFKNSGERFPPDLELESDTKPASAVKGVISSLQRGLARLETVTDVNLLEKAASVLYSSRLTYAFGVGASGLVALDLYQKFIRIGLPCVFAQDTDMQITAACNLRPQDTAFVVSYSGETSSMLAVATQARRVGATIITLTMDGPNTLRSLSDIPLVIPALERVYRTGAAVSRISQLAVVDMIYAIIVSKNLGVFISAIERTMEATHRGRG